MARAAYSLRLIEADLNSASLKGAHAFAAQMQRMKADGADFSQARLAGDLTGASLKGAIFDGADLAADMKNQSMGLMRAVLRMTQLQGARFQHANLMSADLRFAHAAGADFTDANLANADAAGADFTGAQWRGAKTDGLDLDSARIDAAAGGQRDDHRDRPGRERLRLRGHGERCKRQRTDQPLHAAPPGISSTVFVGRKSRRSAGKRIPISALRRLAARLIHIKPVDLWRARGRQCCAHLIGSGGFAASAPS